MRIRIKKTWLGMLLLFLAACSGGGAGSGDQSAEGSKKISGAVVKGPIASATLRLRSVNPITGEIAESVLAETQTDASGGFELDLNSFNGPILIESTGGSFIDESDQNTDGGARRQIVLGPEDGLRVYRPAGVSQVALTMVSDAMTGRAFEVAQQQQISLDNAFEAVLTLTTAALGFNPLTTPAVNPLNPPQGASNAIVSYGLTIGGLAYAANEAAIRAGLPQMTPDVIGAVISDLFDGVLDGRLDGESILINGQPMPDVDFAGAIQRFRNNNNGAYVGVVPPTPDEAAWSAPAEPSNSAPQVTVNQQALFVAEGGVLLLDASVLQASDQETATEDLRFLLVEPAVFGDVTDGENVLAPNHQPVAQLQYVNQGYPSEGSGEFLRIAVVDADNGAAFVDLPILVDGIPQLQDDFATTNEDVSISVDVLANDVDPEEVPLTFAAAPTASTGSVSVVDNQIFFVPEENFNGEVTVDYSVTDGSHTVSAQLFITLTAVNDAPVAVDDAATVNEDAVVQIDVLTNDTDVDGDALNVLANPPPSSGNGQVTIAGQQLQYLPNADFNGEDVISYSVTDGNLTSTANVFVTVNAVNDAPEITGQNPIDTDEDTPRMITLADLQTIDADGDSLSVLVQDGEGYTRNGNQVTPLENATTALLVVMVVNDGTVDSAVFNATVTINPVNDAPEITGQNPLDTDEDTAITLTIADFQTVDADGDNLTLLVQDGSGYARIGNQITPDQDQNGPLVVNVVVNDGTVNSAVFNATVNVNPVNDVPEITGQNPLNSDEDTAVTLTLADFIAFDADGDNLTLLVQDSAGYTRSGNQITPDQDFNGALTVPVLVNDGSVDSAIFNATVTVDAVNDAPEITAQNALQVDEDMPLTLFLQDFTTVDVDGDNLTLVVQDGNGYSRNGNQVTPNQDFNGALTVFVVVNDGTVDSAVFNANISVNPINDAPVITGQNVIDTNEDTPRTIVFADIATFDAEADNLTLLVQDGANYIRSGNQITPNLDYNGPLTVPLIVNDGSDDSAIFNATVDVVAVNDAPVANNDVASIAEDGSVLIDVLNNDLDADGDSLEIVAASLTATNGVASVEAGQLRYVPNNNFNGVDTLSYEVTDNNGGNAQANVTVTVSSELDGFVQVDANGSDGPYCGMVPSPPCATIQQGLLVAEQESNENAAADIMVQVIGGTAFDVNDINGNITMLPNVSLSGSWNPSFDQQDFELFPTVVGNSSSGGDPTVECAPQSPAVIGTNVSFSGFKVVASAAPPHVALKVRENCQAEFTLNHFNGVGSSNEDSRALVVGNQADTTPPTARFIGNRFWAGDAATPNSQIAIEIVNHGGLLFEGNTIDGGPSDAPGELQNVGVAVNFAAANSNVVELVNNQILGNGVGLEFSAQVDVLLVNNTIAGFDTVGASSSGLVGSTVIAINNLLMPGLLENPCVNNLADSGTVQFSHTVCANALGPDPSPVFANEGFATLSDTNSLSLERAALGLVTSSVGNQGQFAPSLLVPVDLFGVVGATLQASGSDQWIPTGESHCAVLDGGLSPVGNINVPPVDIGGGNRDAVIAGRCAYVEPLAFGEFVSIGAYDHDAAAKYVAANGQGTDCLLGAPCSFTDAIFQLGGTPGEELRLADGAYTLSATNLEFPGPLSIIGGYPADYSGVPVCDQQCATAFALDTTATGVDENTVFKCDSINSMFPSPPGLIAGLNIDATDSSNAAVTTKAISLQNGCDMAIVSNHIHGGDGGDGSASAYGIEVIGLDTAVEITNNTITGGSAGTHTVGIIAGDDQQLFIAGNTIQGNDDQNIATPNAQFSRAVWLGMQDGDVSGTGFISLLDNDLDAGIANDTAAVRLENVGNVEVVGNRIYGGTAGVTDSQGLTIGLSVSSYGAVNIHNNVIHGGQFSNASGNGQEALTQGIILFADADAADMAVRNNTVFSGVASPTKGQVGIAFGLSSGVTAYSNLALDNNIVFTPLTGGSAQQCFREENALIPSSVRNNNAFACATGYTEVGGQDGFSPANNAADNNEFSDPTFVDQDGADNQAGSNDFDWHLQTNSPCEIAEGGLDGALESPPFFYGDDIEHNLRTGDPQGPNGPGWSMGAYEQEGCFGGA